MHNDVSGCAIFTSDKTEYLKKFYQRSYIIILTDLSHVIKKLWEKISFHKHFNLNSSLHRVFAIFFLMYNILIF